MTKQVFSSDALKEMDKRSILHPATSINDVLENGPRIMSHGKGSRVVDSEGVELVDAVGGLWCVNIGYGRPEIGTAMRDACENMGYFHTFAGVSNPDQIKLADRLVKMAPAHLNKVFFGNSGSDANDSLIKMVWYVNYLKGRPEKRKIISRRQSYHGTTVATASLTGLASFHKGFGLPIADIIHVSTPHYYRFHEEGESELAYSARLARELEETILAQGPETVGAFIAEPVMGAGGVITPPKGYFEAVQEILSKYDILFICDEVVCGFGRLGVMWGNEVYNIRPDMMTTAKGLTSGYFPMSAAFISDEIWQVMREGSKDMGPFAHGFTYSGHPVGAAAALANLDIIEGEGLIENSATVGAYMHQGLRAAIGDHGNIGEIRGQGLLFGIQLVEDRSARKLFDPALKTAARVAKCANELGLIVRPLPTADTIAMSPPLVFSKNDADFAIERFKRALETAMVSQS